MLLLLKEIVVDFGVGVTKHFAVSQDDNSYLSVHNKDTGELVINRCKPNPDPEKYHGGRIWVDTLAVYRTWNHWDSVKTVERIENLEK